MSNATSAPCWITGMGALSPLGLDIPSFWASLQACKTAIAPLNRFDATAFSVGIAAEVPEGWREQLDETFRQRGLHPCAEFGIIAAKEAWAAADLTDISPTRIAVVLGTNMGDLIESSMPSAVPWPFFGRGCHTQTAAIAEAIGAKGPRATLVTACAASTNAVGYGRDLLLAGDADVVIAGGADVLAMELYAGFYALGAICPQPCAPFSEPQGMSLGEGAGFVVLERPDHAKARGATPHGIVLGYGLSADGHHAATPDPRGQGVARSLTVALADAGVLPHQIDAINAHATGTPANDPAEWQGFLKALGPLANERPVSALKSYFGHPQGAAGILEIIAIVLAMQHGCILPTLHVDKLRPDSPSDPVAEGRPRQAKVGLMLKHSAAFGGANASLVLSHPAPASASPKPLQPEVQTQARRLSAADQDDPIVVVGLGGVGGHGNEGLHQAWQRAESAYTWVNMRKRDEHCEGWAGQVPDAALGRWVRHPGLRDADRAALFLTQAASQALKTAGIQLRGQRKEQAGIFIGVSGDPTHSGNLFVESIEQRGATRASANAFTHAVPNAAAGATSAALSLKGPHSVLAGTHSGLWAVVYAARWLANHPETELLIAGGVDELSYDWLHATQEKNPHDPHKPPVLSNPQAPWEIPGEGASCVALTRRSYAQEHQLAILATIEGMATAGPAQLHEAIQRCLAPCTPATEDLSPGGIDAIYSGSRAASIAKEQDALATLLGDARPLFHPAPILGTGIAATASFAFQAAVEALQQQKLHDARPETTSSSSLKRILVLAHDESMGSCALSVGVT